MKNIFSVFKRKKSSEVAKDRLKILLISDRVNCSPEVLERIKADIAEVISKYMKIDVNTMEIQISKTGMKSINNTKTPTLYANIPILDLRNK
jgi:cell division topological specificity factor